MPLAPYDGTVPENTGDFNTFVTNLGIDTSGGGGSYGHGVYFSASSGGTNWGYCYHLPPTWTTEPTRKFPVVYVPSLGGGSNENEWFRRCQVADPLADSPVYTSNQDGSPWFLNWGKNAKCVTIVLNGGLDIPFPFNANPLADMNGVLMLETQQAEAINFIESPSHPVFGGRLVPQGTSDPNGGKYRGIMGHSGGTHHSAYHAALNPGRYSSVFLLAVSGGGDWDPAFTTPGFGPWQIHMCNSDQSFGTSIWAIHRPDGAFGAAFVANQTNIFNAGIWWHMQVSHPEGINETVSTNFWNNLNSNGFNVDAEILIPFSWHTSWCYTGSGGPKPLPWAISKMKLNPTCNGPTGLTTNMNTALHVSSATVVANDTDPQLLSLSVASVGSPTHGSVSLSGGTVTFTPTTGFTGTASFSYTAQNTDGQTNTGTASINVTPAIPTIAFPSVTFSATGASTPRTMPNRLNDIINVKDWGAVGDGVANDAAAIQAAIDYAYTVSGNLGGRVFFPAGTYNVGSTTIRMAAPVFAGSQALQLVGAGKRVSIIKGNNTDAILADHSADAKVELIKNLTVWNQSTVANSHAIFFDTGGIGNGCRFDNLRLIAMIGVDVAANAFPVSWMNCDAICSASIGANPDILTIPAANSGAPGPVAGTFGFYVGQWPVYNCSATGFDIGFIITNAGGPMFAGNRAYRCNTGFYPGLGRAGQSSFDGNMYGCLAERCLVGINAGNTSGAIIAGNVVRGETDSGINTAVSPSSGPAEPAAIQSMSWNPATHVVTVTTLANHNLAVGTQTLSLALSPSSWYPSGNTDGLVSCTTGAANTFTYAGPSSSPPAFSVGTWNYPMQTGFISAVTLGSSFFANSVDAPASRFSVDMAPAGGPTFQYQGCAVMAMNGKYGWNFPPGSSGSGPCNIYLLQIGADFPTIVSTATGGVEEVIFSDGQPGLGFNALFVGGGSTQYKARRTGANFAVTG